MKRGIFTLVFVLLIKLLTAQITMVNVAWIDEIRQNKSDTVYIVNFWATWCKPCVEELPYFEKLTETYKGKKVKVILVSCDFKKEIDQRVVPFIKKRNIRSQVVFMNESNPDTWIEKVDKGFSGAIPATWIRYGAKTFSFFKEGEISYIELENIINPLIN